MGRPAISAKVTAKHLSDTEKNSKLAAEERLRGKADRLRPPKYLTASQKKIFRFIVGEMQESGVLGNLDVYVLAECSIALDRMQEIESQINSDFSMIASQSLMSAKDKYTRSFFRCCNELCLSPQSRAKIGNINLTATEENPLLKILSEEEEE